MVSKKFLQHMLMQIFSSMFINAIPSQRSICIVFVALVKVDIVSVALGAKALGVLEIANGPHP